jgi:hypothetical protein
MQPCSTLKTISATHVIKLGFAPNSYSPGQQFIASVNYTGNETVGQMSACLHPK